MVSNIDLVELKWPYIFIPASDEGNLGDVGKMNQNTTTLSFTKLFQFQCLLGLKGLSIEV
jgi:hypothetical protein